MKTASFSRKGRHWYVNLVVDVPVAADHARPETAVGLDVGIEHLVTTSDGRHIENVRPRSRRERDLRIAQRALARCKRGSKRRAKVRERVGKIQRDIANVRSNHLHQVSADLARRYALIAVEDLRLKNLTRSARGSAEQPGKNVRQKAGLNRAMLDASPARLIELLTYKAARAGGAVVKVDPRSTSQDCSSCGVTVEKTLAERRHRRDCGADLHRSRNAALNILDRAFRRDGRAGRPGTPTWGLSPCVVPETRALKLRKQPRRSGPGSKVLSTRKAE